MFFIYNYFLIFKVLKTLLFEHVSKIIKIEKEFISMELIIYIKMFNLLNFNLLLLKLKQL